MDVLVAEGFFGDGYDFIVVTGITSIEASGSGDGLWF